jgi:hypothetical protein
MKSTLNNTALSEVTQDIVMDEVFPHPPETIWKTLTTGALIARWPMKPRGFAPVQGTHFTYHQARGRILCPGQTLGAKGGNPKRAKSSADASNRTMCFTSPASIASTDTPLGANVPPARFL